MMAQGAASSSFIQEFHQPIGFPVLQSPGWPWVPRPSNSFYADLSKPGWSLWFKRAWQLVSALVSKLRPSKSPVKLRSGFRILACQGCKTQIGQIPLLSMFGGRSLAPDSNFPRALVTKFPEFTHSQVLGADNSEHVLLVSTLGLPTLV